MAVLIAAVFSLVLAGTVAAADLTAPEVQRLETTFGVTAEQISALQSQGLGFGEIAIVFSIASKMSGGINDANIATIMGDRTGTPPMGWGQISQSVLGENLGQVVSPFASANGAAHSANAGSQGTNAGSQGVVASGGRSSGAGAGASGGGGASGAGGRGGR